MRRIFALAACLLFIPIASADWVSFHGDSRNTGFVPNSDYEVYTDVWWNNKTEGDSQVKASPVLKDGKLITVSLKGLVRALDSESGKEVWRYDLKAPTSATPAIEGERVYVVSERGNLVALNLNDGREEHKTTVGTTLASPTVHEGKLFIGTEGGKMRAYLASTLTLLWDFTLNQGYDLPVDGDGRCTGTRHTNLPIRGAPVVYDGKVFFGSMNHRFYAIDEQGSGDKKTSLMWSYKTDDVIIGSPALVLEKSLVPRITFGSFDGHIYSFVASPNGEGTDKCKGYDHQPHWKVKLPTIIDSVTGEENPSKIESSPATDGKNIYVGANNGHFYILDSNGGAILWENSQVGNADNPITSSPAVANGTVVVGAENGHVYWLSATDARILKEFATESGVQTSPAIDGQRAFVAAKDGTLYMFGPEIPTRADLIVEFIEADILEVRIGVKNVGDRASDPTTLRFFRGGTFVANLDVGALEPNGAVTVTRENDFGTGEFALRALVDPDNVIAESTEANNDLEESILVEDPDAAFTEEPSEEGGGINIPGPALPLVIVGLGLLVAFRRRS